MTVSAITWAPGDFSPPPSELDKVVVRAACPQDCPDTCAMLVTVENGRATEVVGAPEHPFTRGALCVKINNFLDKVYSPDRLRYPMRRVGPKGAGRFERVGWDEALDEITGRFKEIIRRDGAQAILPFSYLGTEGLVNGLNVGDAFFNKMGATISERTFCDSGVCTAYLMTVGPTPGCEPESIINSKYIVLWANNAISTNVHLWPIVRDAQRRGAKLVVIDPVANRTAQHADWHIKIRPGTDGALALAMINVIITEKLTDEDYVRRYTVGYDALAERARQYTPEWAAGETGVPAADIRRLAREFAGTQPSVIRIGVAIERHPNGGQTVRAIACLPALAGSWRRPGGGLCQIPLWSFPVRWNGGPDDVVSHPDLIEGSPRVLNQFMLGPALTGELNLDPPIKGLFVYNSNPLVVVPSQQKVVAGLMRDDLFTVVSEHFQTDTADFADFVLPATTQLEQFDLMFSWGHLYLTMNTPSIEPLGEAIPNAELFRRLAARMGYQEACFSRSDEELARDALDWSAPVLDGIDMEYLKAHGYARLKVGAPETFAPHAEGNFPTPSGKCELESSMARDQGNMVLPLFRQGYTGAMPSNPVDPLPSYTPRRESPYTDPELAKNYPLSLLTPKPHAFLNSTYGNLPRHRRVQGGQTLTVNPADAGARGIADGQRVKVFNHRGAFYATATVSDEVPEGIVMSPMGQWRKHADEMSTVHAVIEPVFADLGNAPAFSDIAVQVAVADGE